MIWFFLIILFVVMVVNSEGFDDFIVSVSLWAVLVGVLMYLNGG